MYDLSGLSYQLESAAIVFGTGSLMFLIRSHFWTAEKRNFRELMIGILFSVLFIGLTGYYMRIINNLEISVQEVTFVDENRESPYLFRTEYCFINEKDKKELFYLDSFSKKKICPEGFIKGKKYRIYYEEKTDVIVKTEKLE